MSENQQPARPKISLPSFRDVQAAERARPAQNMFYNRGTPQGASGGGSAGGQVDISRAAVPPAANQSSHSSQQHRPPSMPEIRTSGLPPSGGSRQAAAALPLGASNSAGTRGYSAAGVPPRQPNFSIAPAHTTPAVDYQAFNASPNGILVSRRQEGNPMLKHIRNVRWAHADIVPDYIMGADACALFLSMRYHLLKPEYIHHRIKELQRSFRLRVLLCHVDIDDVVEPLQQITRAALLNDVTLICGWSPEECARYLETYKVYETKPADAIQGRTDEDYLSRLTAALTSVRGVNKTDVLTLGARFKSATGVMRASTEELAACPGLGPTKVKRLYDAFHEPFRRSLHPVAAPGPSAASSAQAATDDGDPVAALTQLPLDDALADNESGED